MERVYAHNYKEQYTERESNLAKAIVDLLNGCCSMKPNAEFLARYEHRYLQNEAFKFCILYIKELAKNYDSGTFDGRNEYACKTAKSIVEMLENDTY